MSLHLKSIPVTDATRKRGRGAKAITISANSSFQWVHQHRA